MIASHLDRYVIGREQNVVRVNFARDSEPPTPPFPGAGALRLFAWQLQPDMVASMRRKAEIVR
ncbi:MAG: hypothetical protein ACOY5F_20220 [Pseudomonadota bacterium]